jgi:hypothetical protein
MTFHQPYVGSELELFARAVNWKRYVSRIIRPYLGAVVIEVGAGLGSTTTYLCHGTHHLRWVCLDPDSRHVQHLAKRIAAGELPPYCEARIGILGDLGPDDNADSIVYIDVLEHIQNDEEEIRLAAQRVTTGGHIVTLSPAFNFLYSPFDAAIGHYRRYTSKDVGRLTVSSLTLRSVFFIDSLGFFASALNRLILQKSMPSTYQIRIWDKALVPVSTVADRLFGRLFGKSIVIIWQKNK